MGESATNTNVHCFFFALHFAFCIGYRYRYSDFGVPSLIIMRKPGSFKGIPVRHIPYINPKDLFIRGPTPPPSTVDVHNNQKLSRE